ncbi:regulatory particle non-ATPase 10 [Brevipalpus obovatus]|uniref:regulatory particle non-ATPase 10 n=1 Tax=Brevipalpus obovatus TaxID=246614 RepID=UPI003D9F5E2D
MVLESTIVCVDSSEYMRNGDFAPSRLQAQQEAVQVICHTKTRSNAENNVGLISMAPNAQVLTALTADVNRILSKLHQVQPSGDLNLVTGIRVAHLALKHRSGKNHKMRIVAFVGSPIDGDEKELVKVAKRLKKEKVNVDVINFGEEESNTTKLTAFINALNGKDGSGSHLVTVPPGPHLSDALKGSPVIQGEDGAGAGMGSGGFEFGEEDPDLAFALRVSMEEQRQRQEEEARRVASASGQPESVSQPQDATASSSSSQAASGQSEEALLERALAMSLESDRQSVPANPPMPGQDVPNFSTMTEEEQIAYAVQMSLQQSHEEATKQPSKEEKEPEPMETDQAEDKKESDSKS